MGVVLGKQEGRMKKTQEKVVKKIRSSKAEKGTRQTRRRIMMEE